MKSATTVGRIMSKRALNLNADRLATGPFPLMATPVYSQRLTKPYEPYAEAASVMTLAHNVIIRGLNSIYRQGPYILQKDHEDFIGYARCWWEILDGHHHNEEENLFPQIVKITGESADMEANVEQHHAFLPGLTAYKDYLADCSQRPSVFSGSKLNSIIDGFAPLLIEHLNAEIPTLLALSRFGSKLPLLDMVNQEALRSPQMLSKTGGVVFFLRNLDLGFEDGLWKTWPPIPAPVWWMIMRSVAQWNKGWWRFASATDSGMTRELYALDKHYQDKKRPD